MGMEVTRSKAKALSKIKQAYDEAKEVYDSEMNYAEDLRNNARITEAFKNMTEFKELLEQIKRGMNG